MAVTQHAGLTGADLHEPKGVAVATANTVLVAGGAGTADWINPTAYAEVNLDLAGPLTRTFIGATPYTNFILDYVAGHEVMLSYNDTTKELTYTGLRDIVVRYSMALSIKRTGTGGSPELTVAMFEDIGAGFIEITSSRVARTFPGTDAGSMTMEGIHTLTNGDKLKLQVKTDASIDVELRNLNWSVTFVGLV